MLILTSPSLSNSLRISHGFFGRGGGVSEGIFASLNCGPGSGDAREAVAENRRRAATALSPGATLLTLYQIHSADAVVVTEPWETGPKADAMATNVPGLALGILTADCAPVLLADEKAGVIAAAHAGWKGALAGVTDEAIGAMERLGAARARIAAAIGPCIAQASYEVGPEFAPRFGAFVADRHFDLAGYVAKRLADARIADVARISADTYARDADFFSYRRATHRGETDYGRQVSAIVLAS